MKDLILTAISKEDLEALVAHQLDLAFRRHSQPKQRQPDDVPGQDAPPFVSKREAARLISVCQSSIDGYARKGQLKRRYVGKKVVFDRSEVLALAKTNTNHKQKRLSNE